MKKILTEKDIIILKEIVSEEKDIDTIEQLLLIEKDYEMSGRRFGIWDRLKETLNTN